jgi:hypothetical protein
MDQTTQQNAALVEESAAAAENLMQQAQVLVQTVGLQARRWRWSKFGIEPSSSRLKLRMPPGAGEAHPQGLSTSIRIASRRVGICLRYTAATRPWSRISPTEAELSQ